jgi:hypothetical protein
VLTLCDSWLLELAGIGSSEAYSKEGLSGPILSFRTGRGLGLEVEIDRADGGKSRSVMYAEGDGFFLPNRRQELATVGLKPSLRGKGV